MSEGWKRFAIVQLVVCLAVVIGQGWWCQYIHFLDLDWCWFLSASGVELERGFPNYHRLVYTANLALDYGLPIISLAFALRYIGVGLRKNMGLVLFSTAISLVFAEVGLRMIGWRPGQFTYSKWVEPVDSLVALRGIKADGLGMTSVDTAVANDLWSKRPSWEKEGFPESFQSEYVNELLRMLEDHGLDSNRENRTEEFWKRYRAILDQTVRTKDQELFVEFADHPINNLGFYSIPFDTNDISDRILLLGDSFTWGHSASHMTNGFANRLLARGYSVYNSGISGSDVPQYEVVLRRFGPELKPKVVLLSFFMGNDVSFFQRVPRSFVPVHYTTNAGNFLSFQNGVLFPSDQQAYENVMRNMVIPQTTSVNRSMSKTVVTTMLWEFLTHQNVIHHEFFTGEPYPDRPLTDMEIKTISDLCDSLGTRLILSVIPSLEKGELKGAESIPGLFGDVPYHQPDVTPEMYNWKDGHFNDEGHLFYANYLEALIKEALAEGPVKVTVNDTVP